ncbi:MAG: hypothetical protein OEU36_18685 [Gammaproteobacteria bacterium]|nr:hypothetical protein [Gammaproteobacteria bacterium]
MRIISPALSSNALQFLAVFYLFTAMSGCALNSSEKSYQPSAGQNKITLCHKGKNTLSVAEPATQAHLKHGDTLGACG